MRRKRAIRKGLTDTELIAKYEKGEVDIKKPIMKLIRGGKSPKKKKA